MKKINLAVLISGRGSNLKSIIENIKNGYLDRVELKTVIANKDASGLKFAKEFGILTFIVPRVENGKKLPLEEHDEKVMEIVDKYEIDLICLAGYLQVLQPKFVKKYRGKIMNIHPAILPAFPATIHAQKEAVEYGVKVSGCTVHFVDEGIDTGPIIIQAAVPVKDDDTEETLSKRILEFEHIIYPKAIKMFSENRLEIKRRKVIVKRKMSVEVLARNSLNTETVNQEMNKAGVSKEVVDKLSDKTEYCAIFIKDITPREAIVIKQELMALGGDCATPKECILNSLVPVSVIVIGNKKQLKKLIKILETQVFDLPKIATILREKICEDYEKNCFY